MTHLSTTAALLVAFAAQAHPFGPGEQTTYTVSWLGLVAGQAQVTVGWPKELEGHTVWPLVCVGQTTNMASLYRVNDRFTSFWSPTLGQPTEADFRVSENRFRMRDRYVYDRGSHVAITERHREGIAPYELRFDMPDSTVDLASAAFSLRTAPLAVGFERELPIFTGVKVYRMAARVENVERLATALGPLDVFRMSVNTDFDGPLSASNRATLFFTTDQRHLPVRAEAEFALGRVVLEVTTYEPGRTDLPPIP